MKRKIHNFTPELGLTPSKEKSTNRESEGDDKRLSSHIKSVSQLRVVGEHHEEKVKEKRKVSQLRVKGDHHEEKVNEKRKIRNFTPELRMTLSKQKSTNKESEGDDIRLSSHINQVSKLRVEGDHHEEKVNEKRKNHNFTPELRMTLSKQKSTNRVSQLRVEGDHPEEKVNEKRKIHDFTLELRMTPSKQKSTNRESEGVNKRLSSHLKYVLQLIVVGDHHEEKVNEKRKIHNFTPALRMTPNKQKSTNRVSEGDEKK
ncbi:hypothetical protein Tco_0927151 [Tanacetum coccineum]